MGEAGWFFGGLTGKTKADFTGGTAPFVSYLNVFSNIAVDLGRPDFVRIGPDERQRVVEAGDVLFTGSSESAYEVGMSSVITSHPGQPTYLNSFSIGYRTHRRGMLDPDFAKHLFRSTAMRRQIVRAASGVTRFNMSKSRMQKIAMPVPDMPEQRRIAHNLDALDALVNDISVGLPAEIAARRKQYEYYRDKLLTFKEAPA